MSATAIIPVKRFNLAKQRLGSGMDGEQRRELVAAMLGDVFEALPGARTVERTIVVTGDPEASEMATAAGFEVIPDSANEGHSGAAILGISAALEGGATCAILLPGDCPLLDPREVDSLLTAVPERYVTVVPDRHGTGTNGLVLSPPDAITPAFGEGSCERHVDLARDAGIPHAVERRDSLGLDLDTLVDIIALTRELHGGRGGATRTAQVLGI